MAKKFFSANINFKNYRVFLDDVKMICKRLKKARPALPNLNQEPVNSSLQSVDSPNQDLNDMTAEEVMVWK